MARRTQRGILIPFSLILLFVLAVSAVAQADVRPLELGKPMSRELRGSETHAYEIELTTGQFLRATVELHNIYVVITVSGPDGKQLLDNSFHGARGPETLSFIAEASGKYRLNISLVQMAQAMAGQYEIKIVELRPASPEDRSRFAATQATREALLFIERQDTEEGRRKAIEKYEEAVVLWRAIGDRREEANALDLIGLIYLKLGEVQKALGYLRQSVLLWQAVGDRSREARGLNSIGNALNVLGEKQAALDSQNQALAIWQAIGNRSGEARTLNNIAVVYSSLGKKQVALDYYTQVLTVRRKLGEGATGDASMLNKLELANTLDNLGRVYNDLGEKQKALDYFEQALVLNRETLGRDSEAKTLLNIGGTYSDLGENEKALDYFKQALPVVRALGYRNDEASILLHIARAYSDLSQHSTAIDYFGQALALYRAVGNRSGQANALYGAARSQRDLGNVNEAITQIETALTLVDEIRTRVASQELRTSYSASVQKYYELYIDLLMQMHKQHPAENFDARALHTSERARARSLLELLVEARADIRQGIDPKLLEAERSLRRTLTAKAESQIRLLSGKSSAEQVTAIAKEIDRLTTDYDNLLARIRQSSPRYAALTQPVPLTVKEIQTEILDQDTILLEYALGQEKSFLWAVGSASITSFELPKRAEIEASARRVYEALTARNRSVKNETPEQKQVRLDRQNAEFKQANAELSRMLLAPVESQLGTKRLLIVSDGALQYIPFGALPVRSADAAKTADAAMVPLIARHEIVSLPSASVLGVLRREMVGRKPASKEVAVLADPVFGRDDPRIGNGATAKVNDAADQGDVLRSASESGLETFVRLRFSRQEAEASTRLAPAGKKLTALDFAASRENATSSELGQYRIVHFATHGLINSQHPELSGLVLSLVDKEGKPQNGFLRLHEIYNLRLEADLVVLSACQTALGNEIQGEGLIGLTRGFMYAGAPRVVASLWQVDDRASANLMKYFYDGMLGQGLRPAAALRAAQISMMKDKRWQSPYYWAAFTLQGEWR